MTEELKEKFGGLGGPEYEIPVEGKKPKERTRKEALEEAVRGFEIKNVWQLKKLCQQELGVYTGLFEIILKDLSGYKRPEGLLRPDPEEERRKIEAAMKSTALSPELIEHVNQAIAGIVKSNKGEINFFKDRPGKEKYIRDCQRVVEVLNGRRLALDEDRNAYFKGLQ